LTKNTQKPPDTVPLRLISEENMKAYKMVRAGGKDGRLVQQ